MAAEQGSSDQGRENGKLWLEVWKHYDSSGGGDKNTMVKVVTWLLAFSTAALSAYATGKFTKAPSDMIVLGLSGLLALLAAFVAVIYGAYAAWNWAIADQIARKWGWKEEQPPPDIESQRAKWGSPLRFAGPCQGKVAPIFKIFCLVSLVVAGADALLIFLTLARGAG